MKYFVIFLFLISFVGFIIPQAFSAGENFFYGTATFERLPFTIVPNISTEFEIKFHYTTGSYALKNFSPIIEVSPEGARSKVHFDVEPTNIYQNDIARIPVTITVDPSIEYEKIFLSISYVGIGLHDVPFKSSWSNSIIFDIDHDVINENSSSPNDEEKTIPSPLKQFKSGIRIDQIQCKEGLQLITKKKTAMPVCVKEDSANDLIELGWAIPIDSMKKTPDIVVTNPEPNNVSILFGDGMGSFGEATILAAGVNPYSITVDDFNGDGKQDLATANMGSNNVSILLGDSTGGFGKGAFGVATNFAVGIQPKSIAVADFNGDNKQDLATANIGSNDTTVLLGDGTGGFGTADHFAVGTLPESIAVADFNGDDKQDLALSNIVSNDVTILLGDGTGAFGTTTHFAVGESPYTIAVADFNGDSKYDLAVSNRFSNISVLLGDGTGGFEVAKNFAAGKYPYYVAVADFNGDSKQDLVTANTGSNDVSILLGDGTGGFGTAVNFAVGINPISIAVDDFNGDNKQDLAVVNNYHNVSILLGDGTGSFGVADNFAAGMGPVSIAIGNFD